MTHYEYTLWTETTCDGTRYFWLVDEVFENGQEKTVDSGIELTRKEALDKIKKYIPDAEA